MDRIDPLSVASGFAADVDVGSGAPGARKAVPPARELAVIAPGDDLRRAFKDVFSELASGVCVVTFWRCGRVHGFTATSVTSVSLSPLRVLFCIAQASHSFSCLTTGSVIGISILNAEQRALSDRFASRSAFGAYDDVKVIDGSHAAPLLDGALGHVTATIADMIPSGDHSIVLCDVTSAHVEANRAPLLYCSRTYHTLHHRL
jgi:flavin reductase (DIM6/NTAB) family NADH-FMN oxidoreductase RutF